MPRRGCSTAASCCSVRLTGASRGSRSTTSSTSCQRIPLRPRPLALASRRTGRRVPRVRRGVGVGVKSTLCVRAASPTRLLQHLAMLVLPHLLTPLLYDRTQANSCAGLTDELELTQPPRAGRNDNALQRGDARRPYRTARTSATMSALQTHGKRTSVHM